MRFFKGFWDFTRTYTGQMLADMNSNIHALEGGSMGCCGSGCSGVCTGGVFVEGLGPSGSQWLDPQTALIAVGWSFFNTSPIV